MNENPAAWSIGAGDGGPLAGLPAAERDLGLLRSRRERSPSHRRG